jgi:hypothetical protein
MISSNGKIRITSLLLTLSYLREVSAEKKFAAETLIVTMSIKRDQDLNPVIINPSLSQKRNVKPVNR